MSTDKVLSICMRPKNLDEIIGLDDVVEIITNQFKSKRIPHFYLIVGESGSCKTTLARIIALMLQQQDPHNVKYEYNISKYDITEINASNKNGVDDIRELLDLIKYKPLKPSLAKVYILDEAHQLTTAAQNALLKDLEDTPDHVYFIFCTNNDSKILPTIKRRAYIINTHGVDKESMHKILLKAKDIAKFSGDIEKFEEALVENDINSPGFILQAAEKYFNGSDINEAIYGTSDISVDTKKLCQLITKGNWKDSVPILKTVKKDDIVMLRNCILGYLKAVLFNSGSTKIAQAIKIIAEEVYDLPTFLANICIACSHIKSN